MGFASTWHYFVLMGAVTPVIFASLAIYRWIVRTSNPRLFKQLVKGSALSALALLVLMFLLPGTESVRPRSLFVIYGVFLTISTIGIRFLWQWMLNANAVVETAEPVAVYGAGRRGQDLVDLLQLSRKSSVVLFLDDDPALSGKTVSGVPVINPGSSGLGSTLAAHEVNRVILASPKLDRPRIKRLLLSAAGHNVSVQTLPTINEVVAGQALAGEAREIELADLLGRDEVPPDTQLLSASVTGKSVLITGEICRQCLQLNPKRLIVLDQSEINLYAITEDIQALINADGSPFTSVQFSPILGSVTDRASVHKLLKESDVDIVFHAAAYKHVPIIESALGEGYRTNVQGTRIVLEEAINLSVGQFVLISTDKAVRPTNIMGATKRVAEMLLQAYSDKAEHTTISMVRFGNVLGSSGSVVPKFKEQIDNGGPITLTHSDISRYFMSIPEASQLVLQAASLSNGGEVFVLDMGEPVKIIELAQAMIELSGLTIKNDDQPDGDITIEITGLRPGEKLYEEMFIGEDSQPTHVRKVFVARESYLPLDKLNERLGMLEKMIEISNLAGSREILMSLVVEGSSTSQFSAGQLPNKISTSVSSEKKPRKQLEVNVVDESEA